MKKLPWAENVEMMEMKCYFSFGNGVLNLPVSVLDKCKEADRLQLCVLLFAAEYRDTDTEEFAAALRQKGIPCSGEQAKEALAFWEKQGVLSLSSAAVQAGTEKPAEKKLSELPMYSGAELAEKLTENDSRLARLIDRCQQMAGKLFNPTDVGRLVGLCDYLGLETEYIELLFSYCIEKGKTSLGYLEKTARNLFSEGVETTQALQCYLEKKRVCDALEPFVRRMLGLGERTLTGKEKGILNRWAEVGYPKDVLQLAYESMIASAGKVSFAYMDKILLRWSEAGYTTKEQVEAGQQAFREEQKESRKPDAHSSFQTDDFFQKALKRSYQKADKKTEDPR